MKKNRKRELLAARLRDERGKKGWSQPEAAKRVGCYLNTYKGWELGKTFPQAKWHEGIVKTFKLPADYFLSLDGGAPDDFAEKMEDELRAMRSQLDLILRAVSPPGIDVDDLERAMRVLDALHAQESQPTD